MKILVTGGLGHIGSRLIRVLAETDGISLIRILDNMSTQRYASLFNLPGRGNYEFLEGDIFDDAVLERAMETIDRVVHLAAVTNAEGSFAIKDQVFKTNVEGTERVVKAAVREKARQVIFPSTTSVYGPQSAVVNEHCGEDELKPQSPYAESKLAAERIVLDAGKSAGMQNCVFRFGTIFGPSPGMRFHTAVNKFIFQACLGRPLTVWEWALHQKRPYLDIEDAVGSIRFALNNPDAMMNDLFNVVTLNATVQEIIDAIRRHAPQLGVALTQTPILNQQSYEVDSAKIRAHGFVFQGDLDRGISETVELLRSLNRNPSQSMVLS